MKCPHCPEHFFEHATHNMLNKDIDGYWIIERHMCPSCKRIIIYLCSSQELNPDQSPRLIKSKKLIYPKGTNRNPVP